MSEARYEQGELPQLTDEQRAKLKVLAARPDSEIDYSDIPPTTDAQWADAVRGRFYRKLDPLATNQGVEAPKRRGGEQ